MDHVSLDGVGLLRRRMAGVFAIALAIVMLARRIIGARERRGGRWEAVARWEWPRASSERAGSRMQHHSTPGLDRNEGRHFTVSAARLAHESSSGRACPAPEIR